MRARRALVFLGSAIILLASAEIGLRLTAAIIRLAESRSSRPLGDGKIRILCLGESTTASNLPFDDSWPALLRRRLDAAGGRTYEVVNRGRSGITTDVIADRLPWLLDAERPKIVITMMGVNDVGAGFLRLEPREPDVLMLTRVWKWARHEAARDLWLAKMARRARAEGPQDEARRTQACEEILELRLTVAGLDLCTPDPGRDSRDWKAIFASGAALWLDGNRQEAENRFERALRAAPGREAEVQTEIAAFLLHMGDDKSFERHWRAAWAKRPWDPGLVQLRFRELIRSETRLGEAAALARGMIERYPTNGVGHDMLLELMHNRSTAPGKAEEAEGLREGEIASRMAPDDYNFQADLALAYAQAGRKKEAEALMERLGSQAGMEQRSNLVVARFFAAEGREAKAAAVYVRTAAEESAHRATIDKFGEVLLRAGRRDEAARLFDLLDAQREASAGRASILASDPETETRENYQRIGRMLRARGIAWIAMQYPLRPLSRLQALTSGFPEAVLVENRTNFLEAGRRSPSTQLFVDRFAGDFGHCSRDGYELIAEAAEKAVRSEAGTSR